jgi:sterol desaturase/sphingolipid hydroxylase (fatty acid hydroxylase superfamily)
MDRQDWLISAVAFTIFAMVIGLEMAWWRWRRVSKYESADSLANCSLVLMQFALGVAGKSLFIVTGLEWIRERGPRAVTDGWLSGLLLFLGVDLGYYLFHRASHRVRVLWAIHESHHSSERMNFSVALRQPPLEPLVDWLFFSGLAWLGFSAKAILTVYAFNLFYQFFIHTEVIRRLPLGLEWILNSPSHHRVHHGSNFEYIDRNYGGTLIIWDRLLGTFTAEREAVRYGVTHPVTSRNPLFIAFHLWNELIQDLLASRSWGERLRNLFAPPDWAEVNRSVRGQASGDRTIT